MPRNMRYALILSIIWSYYCTGFVSLRQLYNRLFVLSQEFANDELGTLWAECANSPGPDSPFLSALEDASQDIKHNYFFPNHHGGNHAPQSLLRLLPKAQLKFDLPELDETDNIHAPEGCLIKSLHMAAKLFRAKRTWYLLNGSTSGIHIAMLAAAKRFRQRKQTDKEAGKGMFLIARDAHKSVYDGLSLCNSRAILLPTIVDEKFEVSLGIAVDDLLSTIDTYHEQLSALILTRPTYQGLVLNSHNLRQIVSHCHKYQVPVLIDEAHGAHLRFLHDEGCEDALSCCADVVVQSAHKTLNSLTQTALLHVHNDSLISQEILQEYYSKLTTTSPSSLLLASLDATIADLTSPESQERVVQAAHYAKEMKERIRSNGRGYAELLDDNARKRGLKADPLRLSVRYGNPSLPITSLDIDDKMCEEDGIYCELNLSNCITYIFGLYCTSESLGPLEQSISKALEYMKSITKNAINDNKVSSEIRSERRHEFVVGDVSILLAECEYELLDQVTIPLSEQHSDDLVNTISSETICAYPPGIPTVIVGEKITAQKVRQLLDLQQALQGKELGSYDESESVALGSGCTVTGCSDTTLQTIRVYKL